MFRALKEVKVDLLYSTAWHPQTDGLSERSNQTAEIALRYFIATLEDEKLWPTVLSRMSASLNNSTKYSSTSLAPTQIIYGFKTREALDLLRIEEPDSDFRANDVPTATDNRADDVPAANDNPNATINATTASAYPAIRSAADENDAPALGPLADYRPCHVDAKDAITCAAMRMKEWYDKSHQPKFFKLGELVKLRLHRGYRVPAIKSKKLGPRLIGPFPVVERIGRLAYRLRLPPMMRIHNVILVAHLEPATEQIEVTHYFWAYSIVIK